MDGGSVALNNWGDRTACSMALQGHAKVVWGGRPERLGQVPNRNGAQQFSAVVVAHCQ